MARLHKKLKRHLDYHEGLSANQVEIILREFGFGRNIKQFNKWMFGQTCPVLKRWSALANTEVQEAGVYEYDLFRWIASQKTGGAPIWD